MKENFSGKNLKLHYVLTILIGLGLLFHNVYVDSINIIAKIVALGSLILYYDLTNRFTTLLAIISFILNIILLQFELMLFMTYIQSTSMYQTGDFMYLALVTLLIMWATNKLCIDLIYFKIGKTPKTKMRIEFIIENYRQTKEFKYKDTSNNP